MTRLRELCLLLLIGASAAVAAWRWGHADLRAVVPAPALRSLQPAYVPFTADSIRAAADALIENDPFRISNTPPMRASSARTVAASTSAPPRPPALAQTARVSVVLKAITGGPPWRAVLGGVPGRVGDQVLEPGARFADMELRSISRDSVAIATADSSWWLGLPRRAPAP